MKTIIFPIAIVLLALLTSCTADELPQTEDKNSTKASVSNELNKDGDPPIIIVIKP